MSEYKIPEAMLEAAHRAAPHLGTVSLESALEAAIRYQSENPPVPTDKQAHVLWISQIFAGKTHSDREVARLCSIEWIRRMYRAPEPKVGPALQAVKDAIGRRIGIGICQCDEIVTDIVRSVDEARGQKEGGK